MGLVERGLSPVSWDMATAAPILLDDNPIIALHWGNLLHPDPEQNHQIVDKWADMLTAKAAGLDFILAEDLAACWRQAAAYFLAEFRQEANSIIIDLKAVPKLPCFTGIIAFKIKEAHAKIRHFQGAKVVGQTTGEDAVTTIFLEPEPHQMKIEIFNPD